ncbi:hypothetical protein [Endozoicomonas elysicola]|uniref:Uncharacterized protein n=1 Tax=Endozoicomonas elysicola TaxID=305900 RepID=A0A081KGG8_9GAMM|nr:hypothetical protein [Endozoicomonas elysicola]KEI73244.1 hypothetical protein GV64_23240 [Endozoicomonas elysicola]
MSNSSGVTSKSTVTNEVTDTFQYIHDKGYGSFKGMVTKALNLVEPMARKLEESYAENYRWANTGAAVLAGIGGTLWLCYGSWSFMLWSVAPVVPAMYVGHRFTQPNNSARAISPQVSPEVIAEPAATRDVLLRAGNHNEGSSLRALGVADSRPPDSSKLLETERDTLSERGSEQTASKMMEGVGCLLKNILDLVEMADDLAETYSISTVNSLYKDEKRACVPEIKERQIVQARKALKASFFVTLLQLQSSDTNIADTVYRDTLKVKRGAHFSRICDSQKVDYEKLAKYFLTYAKDSVMGSELLKTPETQAFLLNLFTRGWDVPGQQVSVAKENMKKLLFNDCQMLKKALSRGVEAAHIVTDSAYGSLSAPVADGSSSGNLRQRTHSRQSSTS